MHAHRQLSMDFKLRDSAVEYLSSFNPKVVPIDLIDLVTRVLYDGQCRAWKSLSFKCHWMFNFTEAKSCEMCKAISQKQMMLSRWVCKKTANLEYCSLLLNGQILVLKVCKFWPCMHSRLNKVTYQFLLWITCRVLVFMFCILHQ